MQVGTAAQCGRAVGWTRVGMCVCAECSGFRLVPEPIQKKLACMQGVVFQCKGKETCMLLFDPQAHQIFISELAYPLWILA